MSTASGLGATWHLSGLDQIVRVTRDLEKMLTPQAILQQMMVLKRGNASPEAIIKAIIASAKAGIGPGNAPYTKYSAFYRSILKLAGKIAGKKWLVGITGAPHMLDESRFAAKRVGNALEIVWTGATAEMAEYASDHQEGTGGMPQRTWLHAENTINQEVILDTVELAIMALIEIFNNRTSI